LIISFYLSKLVFSEYSDLERLVRKENEPEIL